MWWGAGHPTQPGSQHAARSPCDDQKRDVLGEETRWKTMFARSLEWQQNKAVWWAERSSCSPAAGVDPMSHACTAVLHPAASSISLVCTCFRLHSLERLEEALRELLRVAHHQAAKANVHWWRTSLQKVLSDGVGEKGCDWCILKCLQSPEFPHSCHALFHWALHPAPCSHSHFASHLPLLRRLELCERLQRHVNKACNTAVVRPVIGTLH